MIVHRSATRIHNEPPVGFYRTIALSFLVLTVALLGVVIYFTSKKATITIVAKEDSKVINLNVSVGRTAGGEDNIPGSVSTGVFSWVEKYHPTGNRLVDDIATGEAIIYNKSGTSQPLVKTTRLLTPTGILFRLSERVIVPANGSVTAKVYADAAGASGNIGPSEFTIPGLSGERQKAVFAESKTAMTGGTRQTGILNDADIEAAKVDYAEKVKRAFGDMTASTTGAFNRKTIAIIGQDLSINKKAGDEVTEFTVSGTSTIAVVYYSVADMAAAVEKDLGSKIDSRSEKMLAVGREPQVSITSYDVATESAQLSVYQEAVVTLDANAENLAALNFLGKSKAEIERYVLGLDHVSGVEVKFTPSWMGTAPGVSDRIKVVVKNVK